MGGDGSGAPGRAHRPLWGRATQPLRQRAVPGPGLGSALPVGSRTCVSAAVPGHVWARNRRASPPPIPAPPQNAPARPGPGGGGWPVPGSLGPASQGAVGAGDLGDPPALPVKRGGTAGGCPRREVGARCRQAASGAAGRARAWRPAELVAVVRNESRSGLFLERWFGHKKFGWEWPRCLCHDIPQERVSGGVHALESPQPL